LPHHLKLTKDSRMSQYTRVRIKGGMYFFTLVTHNRRPFLLSDLARQCLRQAWHEVKRAYPFELIAICLLPDHRHVLLSLPEGDDDYAKRWSALKGKFLDAGGGNGVMSNSRLKRGEAAIRQRRFWEHCIRDEKDHYRHLDYIHFNPVRHKYVNKPSEWVYSTFSKYVKLGYYDNARGAVEPEEIKRSKLFGEVSAKIFCCNANKFRLFRTSIAKHFLLSFAFSPLSTDFQ